MEKQHGDFRELALFCAELPTLRSIAASLGLASRLEQMVAAAQRDESITEGLLEFGIALDDRGPASLPGLGAGRPTDGSYICPTGSCPRTSRRAAGQSRPFCWVHDKPLRFV